MAAPYALDFSPITNALDTSRQLDLQRNKLAMQQEQQDWERARQPLLLRNLGLEVSQREKMNPLELQGKQQEIDTRGLDYDRNITQMYGGIGEKILGAKTQEEKQQYLGMMASDPRFKRMLDAHLPPGWPSNPDLVGHWASTIARGYVDPTKDAQARANLAATEQSNTQALKKNPLDLENLQADIDLKKRKDAIEEFIGSLIKPKQPAQGQPSAPPATPPPSYGGAVPPIGSTPAPGFTVQPPSVQKMGAPADAGVMPGGVTPAQFAPQQAPPQQAAPAAPAQPPSKSVQDIIAERSDAERAAFALTLKKDPAKAAVMLQEWANPEHLGKTTQHDVDKRELDASDHLSKLYAIKQGFDPAYLQTKNQISAWGLNMKDKLNMGAMSPEQQRFLGGYTSFIADSVNNINNQLKILSGTAVSDQEYKRNLMQAPDPGLQGFFSGDGAIAFKAKMDRAIQTQEMAVARYRLARKSGFVGEPWKWTPLESVPQKVNEYAKSLEQKMSAENPGASPDDIRNGVRMQLKTDLGIGI